MEFENNFSAKSAATGKPKSTVITCRFPTSPPVTALHIALWSIQPDKSDKKL